MNPEAAIAGLDRSLQIAGQDISLHRGTTYVAARARITSYSASQLVGEVTQGDSLVIMSPTEIVAASWPAPPRYGDKVVIDGNVRTVISATVFEMANVPVRYELQTRG